MLLIGKSCGCVVADRALAYLSCDVWNSSVEVCSIGKVYTRVLAPFRDSNRLNLGETLVFLAIRDTAIIDKYSDLHGNRREVPSKA